MKQVSHNTAQDHAGLRWELRWGHRDHIFYQRLKRHRRIHRELRLIRRLDGYGYV